MKCVTPARVRVAGGGGVGGVQEGSCRTSEGSGPSQLIQSLTTNREEEEEKVCQRSKVKGLKRVSSDQTDGQIDGQDVCVCVTCLV